MRRAIKCVVMYSLIIFNIFNVAGCSSAGINNKNTSASQLIFKPVESREDYVSLIKDFQKRSQEVIKNYNGVSCKLRSEILNEDNVLIEFFDDYDPITSFMYINFNHISDYIKVDLNFNQAKRCDKREKICEEKENLFYDLIKNCFNDPVSQDNIRKKIDKVRESSNKTIKYRLTTDNNSKIEVGYEGNDLAALHYDFSGEIKCKNELIINEEVNTGRENDLENYLNGKLKNITQLAGERDSDIKVTLNDPLSQNETEKHRYNFLSKQNFGYEYKFIKETINNRPYVQNIIEFNFVVDKGQSFDYDKSAVYEGIKILYNDEINKIISEQIKKYNSGEIKDFIVENNHYKMEKYNENLNIVENVDISKYDSIDAYRISISNVYLVK